MNRLTREMGLPNISPIAFTAVLAVKGAASSGQSEFRRMDQEQLRRMYDEYADGIYRYLLRISGSSELAFDLMQETFLRADRYYKDVRNERAWLYRIAHNLFLNQGRNREIPVEDPELSAPPASGDGFSDDVNWRMLKQDILRKLKSENEIFVKLFLLKLDHGMTQGEIADVTSIPARTVRRNFEKIKNILARDFGRELFGSS